jgi:hypothetical protein
MLWFVAGAVIAMAQLAVSLVVRPVAGGYLLNGFGSAALFGAAIYGTILWYFLG